MKPASGPRARGERERLLVIDPAGDAFADYGIDALPQFFRPGDALVLNDAATLPASLRAGPDLELRLMAELEDGTWLALCLGRGDYRVPTEERGAPPLLALGARLTFCHGLSARVRWLDTSSPRLLRIEFDQ
ncbi:MAG TPA: S-adenosylmethionine:tRNA ribosyltransferase-isomerase, partial [Polyangiaceae bacterium]|nr:S-adenosylmethionine:tRNA ribosyltransferase-isomerase [Polyangiaceae bacterium]